VTTPPSPRARTQLGWPALGARRIGVMGVLNVTPNSFSDGGLFVGAEEAIARALEIERQGADILDIGGESTHPKAPPVTGEEERARVLPVLAALAGRLAIPLSIDTYRAETAEAALAAGAVIVNDIWGLQRDPGMAGVVARHGAGVCIMHNRAAVDAGVDILADIAAFFTRSLEIASQAGIAREAIVLDPGIGFGKTFEQNVAALHGLGALDRFGLPLLVGASRKGFIGALTGRAVPAERLSGSLAAHVAAVLKGARYIRAHDIAEHKDALAVAAAIHNGSME
jgi:dihydropteroate synthase